jgi:hypothetical protein
MNASEKEMELARKYLGREYTEVQFNYLLVQNGIDKKRMESILEYMSYSEPMVIAAKLMLLYIMIHFGFCLAYSIAAFNAG